MRSFRVAILALLPLTTLLSDSRTSCEECPRAKRRLFAIVAASNYVSWDALPAVKTDAGELAALLQNKLAFQPVAPSLRDPTKAGLIQWLNDLPASVREDDDLVVFITGHGTPSGQYVPVNAPNLAAMREEDGVPSRTLLERLFALPARRVLVFLHFCYSGNIAPIAPVPSQAGLVRQVIASASERALNTGAPTDRASPFTTAVLSFFNERLEKFSLKRTCNAGDVAAFTQSAEPEPGRKPRLYPAASDAGSFIFDLDARERDAWEQAVANPGPQSEALKAYLKAWPHAMFRREADAEIERREKEKRESETLHRRRGSDRGGAASDEWTNLNDQLKYVWIPARAPAGAGSVARAGDFWMTQTEVTAAAFDRLVGRKLPRPGFYRGSARDEQPIVNVSRDDAELYCSRAGQGGRLPTDAEWEYAARARQIDRLEFPGAGFEPWQANLRGRVCLAGEAGNCPDDYLFAAPVGSFPSDHNEWLLKDLVGNVSEMTAPVPTKGAAVERPARVNIRGGNFADLIDDAGFSRIRTVDSRGANTVGFRCVIPYNAER